MTSTKKKKSEESTIGELNEFIHSPFDPRDNEWDSFEDNGVVVERRIPIYGRSGTEPGPYVDLDEAMENRGYEFRIIKSSCEIMCHTAHGLRIDSRGELAGTKEPEMGWAGVSGKSLGKKASDYAACLLMASKISLELEASAKALLESDHWKKKIELQKAMVPAQATFHPLATARVAKCAVK